MIALGGASKDPRFRVVSIDTTDGDCTNSGAWIVVVVAGTSGLPTAEQLGEACLRKLAVPTVWCDAAYCPHENSDVTAGYVHFDIRSDCSVDPPAALRLRWDACRLARPPPRRAGRLPVRGERLRPAATVYHW